MFGKVIGIAHNWFKMGKNKCSIHLRFEACQEMEVTPGWISVSICLFELWSQNFLSSNLYFLKFHYEIIVILPWLIIVNWICFIYIIFCFYNHIIWSWHFFIPNSEIKKQKIVNNLVPFRVGGVLHHWYKLAELIDKFTD